MDQLVENTKIVDAELVRAVGSLLPGESLERILDEVRVIISKRAMKVIKSKQFLTVIHVIEHLKTAGLTPSDITNILWKLAEDPDVQDHLKKDINKLLNSGLFNSVFKFVCEIEPLTEERQVKSSFCMCFR
jgi:hypothetical protein